MVVNPPQKPVVSRMRRLSSTRPALEREGHDDADDEAPEDVHRERARGEAVVAETLDDSREPVAGDAADQAAEGDEEHAIGTRGHGASYRPGGGRCRDSEKRPYRDFSEDRETARGAASHCGVQPMNDRYHRVLSW